MKSSVAMKSKVDSKEEKSSLNPPRKWSVVFYNDDITPQTFVLVLLKKEFRMKEAEALSTMEKIQSIGKSSVGEYSKDIALSKREKVLSSSRIMNYPLKVEIEVI